MSTQKALTGGDNERLAGFGRVGEADGGDERLAGFGRVGEADGGGERIAGFDRVGEAAGGLRERIDGFDWGRVAAELDAQGSAVLPGLLAPGACEALAGSYVRDELFRSRVVMARHGFGRGEYRYFAYPLPGLIAGLRTLLYPRLAAIAGAWAAALRSEVVYPGEHDEFLARCHAAGQTRPTPLLLRYEAGDYNCLHQDLYGEHVFPLQVAALLSAPGRDFTGGEFVLTEQRPRLQSRAQVLPLRQGDAAVFAVHHRPVQGTRGASRVQMRHGVSRVLSGQRHALGVIFHDAR